MYKYLFISIQTGDSCSPSADDTANQWIQQRYESFNFKLRYVSLNFLLQHIDFGWFRPINIIFEIFSIKKICWSKVNAQGNSTQPLRRIQHYFNGQSMFEKNCIGNRSLHHHGGGVEMCSISLQINLFVDEQLFDMKKFSEMVEVKIEYFFLNTLYS